jgi:hypothetical protein
MLMSFMVPPSGQEAFILVIELVDAGGLLEGIAVVAAVAVVAI